MGLAFVTALQGNDLKQGVAATIKHFAGYAGGITKDIDQSANVFREESLRPFEVAIRFGKAQSVM
jgi:beta-glucosidase